MKAKLTVEFTPGTTPRESVTEAIRLSLLLNTFICYTFNDVTVCVIGYDVLYCLDTHGHTADWFMKAIV